MNDKQNHADDATLRYKAREEVFRQLEAAKGRAFSLQGDYGKWLISTLLFAHGAAIGFIAQSERLSELLIPKVFSLCVVGLVLALICGFITWVNWSLHASIYGSVDPHMIYLDERWPIFDKRQERWITVTFWSSIATGVASALMIPIAAFCAARLL